MALIKEIELDNGIILNYHRITSLNKITNMSNMIEISSYTSESQRQKEKKYQDLQKKSANEEEFTDEEKEALDKGINVYVNAQYVTTPYDESLTIEDAYDYLKTLNEFKDARDI